jgi:hypothetical protein
MPPFRPELGPGTVRWPVAEHVAVLATVSPAPDEAAVSAPSRVLAAWDVTLPARGRWEATVEVTATAPGGPPAADAPVSGRRADRPRAARRRPAARPAAVRGRRRRGARRPGRARRRHRLSRSAAGGLLPLGAAALLAVAAAGALGTQRIADAAEPATLLRGLDV